MKITNPLGKGGIAVALLTALTGCTTYVVQQPAPQAYTPPPPPPEPVYVQPAPPPPPEPAVVVIQSETDFYEPLSPYGEWVIIAGQGRCWKPAHVEAGWRPYANGHWELTDNGWYWASDEPWGWATYHYGRWEVAGGVGWVWVPQTEWAPAWVSWREGGGYVGWAPLPPERRGGLSVNVVIAPAAFCFVEEGRMHESVRPATVIVNNTTIINKTTIITRTKIVNKVVINDGPRSDEVERVSGRKIQKVSVNDLRHKDEAPVAEKQRDLKAPAESHGPPMMQQKPEVKKDTRPPDLQNRDHGNPPVIPVVQQPVVPRPEPAPVVLHDPQPAPDRSERDRLQHQPNPAAGQTPPDSKNRDRQLPKPQPEVQPAPQPDREHPAKPEKEKTQPAPKEKNPPKEKRNGHDQGGTNTTDNANQDGRRQ